MDIELRNDRIPRNPFDRQFLDMMRHNTQSRFQGQKTTFLLIVGILRCFNLLADLTCESGAAKKDATKQYTCARSAVNRQIFWSVLCRCLS